MAKIETVSYTNEAFKSYLMQLSKDIVWKNSSLAKLYESNTDPYLVEIFVTANRGVLNFDVIRAFPRAVLRKIGIPEINIQGAGIGTLVCYLFICVAGIYLLQRETKCNFNIKNVFIKPLFCSILCGVGAYGSYGLLSKCINSKIATLISIVIAVLVYIVSIFATRTINLNDLKSIPKCKKIVKVLEKWHLIG